MGEKKLKSGWKMWRFDQMATQSTEKINNPSEADTEYYVGLEHLDPESLKIRRWGHPTDVEASKLVFRKGDIIFGKRRVYQRKLAVADFDGICSAHAMVLRAKPKVALPEFLPFFMQSDLFMTRALEISVGSLSPTINWKTLAKEEFALPPLEEQRRIVKPLLAIENGLNSNNELQNEAFTVWRSLSRAEFGKDERKNAPKLNKHYDIVSGQADPKRKPYIDLPLIAPNHIVGGLGKILFLETAREQKAISGKYHFGPGSVLYSKIRPNLLKVAIAPCEGLCSADMYALMPHDTLRKEYLLEILLSDNFTRFAISGSMRTGMPKLNRDFLDRYRYPVPSLSEQDDFLNASQAARNAMEACERRNSESQEYKRSFLRNLLEI